MDLSPKVLLGLPTYKYITVEAHGSHVSFAIENTAKGLLSSFMMVKDVFIDQARNELCCEAAKRHKDGAVTHLVMLDDDVVVPRGALERLLECDRPVVSGLYFNRDGSPAAFDLDTYESVQLPEHLEGDMIVGGVGMGCCLIQSQVIVDMAETFNDLYWFKSGPESSITPGAGSAFIGEDFWFCHRLRDMRVPVTLCLNVVCDHLKTTAVRRKG